ncbi:MULTISPECIES: hypothetical protein [unclassified Crossiella]|uniref:hypothetical protein n=1 Tax=unclassified Crossiella TaxID=2620835 RepID=UPI001FFE3125|nr:MULTISPECIES: hypothetical protein [unclassified Crossiella]MCK2244239.1 hypothetical protein [Crossiella sp. S99.2]MCK2258043.1 hypothetical protein [Crossiella sp. S99.1]
MASSDTGYSGLAGDLFLSLAEDGRLALAPEQAGAIVDDLVRTLDSVHLLLRGSTAEQRGLEAAQRELPKYIEAFRLVRDRG